MYFLILYLSLGMHSDFLDSSVCAVAFWTPYSLISGSQGGKKTEQWREENGAGPLNSLEVTLFGSNNGGGGAIMSATSVSASSLSESGISD